MQVNAGKGFEGQRVYVIATDDSRYFLQGPEIGTGLDQ